MILEKLQQANSVLLDSVIATSNKHAAETFSSQLGLLSNSTTQLEQLLNLMEAMQEKGITPRVVTAEIKEALQNAVDSCGEKVNDHSLDAGTVTALKNAVDLCKGAVAAVWKGTADKQCTPIIESLTSLKGLVANKDAAEKLIEALNVFLISLWIINILIMMLKAIKCTVIIFLQRRDFHITARLLFQRQFVQIAAAQLF